jgi:hypothetical protein
MSDERKKPGWVFWMCVAIALPLLYVLSFGPASWLAGRGHLSGNTVGRAYRPMLLVYRSYVSINLSCAIYWYASAGLRPGDCASLLNHRDSNGTDHYDQFIGH